MDPVLPLMQVMSQSDDEKHTYSSEAVLHHHGKQHINFLNISCVTLG